MFSKKMDARKQNQILIQPMNLKYEVTMKEKNRLIIIFLILIVALLAIFQN